MPSQHALAPAHRSGSKFTASQSSLFIKNQRFHRACVWQLCLLYN